MKLRFVNTELNSNITINNTINNTISNITLCSNALTV